MWGGRWVHTATICAYVVGGANLILLVLGGPPVLTLSLAVVLTPVTLAMALRLTAFLACGVLNVALGDCRDRVELLTCAIGAMHPPSAGEEYREAMIAVIRDPLLRDPQRLGINLLATAPRTILEAWIRLLRPALARLAR